MYSVSSVHCWGLRDYSEVWSGDKLQTFIENYKHGDGAYSLLNSFQVLEVCTARTLAQDTFPSCIMFNLHV
jgi:hypothetical protein